MHKNPQLSSEVQKGVENFSQCLVGNELCRMNGWYQVLNIFFFVFHTAFTLFNVFGWMFRSTRKWNLVTLLLTAFSWFVMGIWYGWGYCVCTDWHWIVRQRLGYHDHSRSYIHFLILKLAGADLDPDMVEKGTLIVFLVSLAASIFLNIRDHRRRKLN